MKKKCKIRIALILFALTTISAVFFVLSDNPPDRATTDYDNVNSSKIIENIPQSGKPSENNIEKENIEMIDGQGIIEKWKGKDVSMIKTDKKIVALTFDGGANADGVEKILSILKDNGIKGTFFLTGEFIRKYPEETKKIIASGGDIGNHSYSHPYFTKLTYEEIGIELDKAGNELSKLNAEFKPIFRFPYGDSDAKSIISVNDRNYIPVRWTVDSLGWKGTSGGMTKNSVKERVILKTVPGAIIMMHLGSNPEDKTQLDSEALQEVINRLEEEGYEFITISEMLNIENL